ncbi:MAG: response regulator [Acidobacteria bacterium]|nr:response regulator [Acidobacteriota bacterium]
MGKKVLLADDSITIQKLVEMAFADTDFVLVSVSDGQQAIDQLADVQPDIILADAIMPLKDGYEVCEYVKSSPQFASTPVVLLTGRFQPFDQAKAEQVRIDGRVVKPFVQEQLVELINRLTSKSPTEAPAESVTPAPPEVEEEEDTDATLMLDASMSLDDEQEETRADYAMEYDSHSTIRVNPADLQAYLRDKAKAEAEAESADDELEIGELDDEDILDDELEGVESDIDDAMADMPSLDDELEDIEEISDDELVADSDNDTSQDRSIEELELDDFSELQDESADDVIDLASDDVMELSNDELMEMEEDDQTITAPDAEVPEDEMASFEPMDLDEPVFMEEAGDTPDLSEMHTDSSYETPSLADDHGSDAVDEEALDLSDDDFMSSDDLDDEIADLGELEDLEELDDLHDDSLGETDFDDLLDEKNEVPLVERDTVSFEDEEPALSTPAAEFLDESADKLLSESDTNFLDQPSEDDALLTPADTDFLENEKIEENVLAPTEFEELDFSEPSALDEIATMPLERPSSITDDSEPSQPLEVPTFEAAPIPEPIDEEPDFEVATEDLDELDQEDLITEPTEVAEGEPAIAELEPVIGEDTLPGQNIVESMDDEPPSLSEELSAIPAEEMAAPDEATSFAEEFGLEPVEEEPVFDAEEMGLVSAEEELDTSFVDDLDDLDAPAPSATWADDEVEDVEEMLDVSADDMPIENFAELESPLDEPEPLDVSMRDIPTAELELDVAVGDEAPIETDFLDESPGEPLESLTEESPEAAPTDVPPPLPVSATSVSLEAGQLDHIIEEVARRVAAKISDDVIREIAWEVIPELAEAMIKKRIHEIEKAASH